jgi:hypothetical protein
MFKYLSDLAPGNKIKTIKGFKDFDGQLIPLGSEWTFIAYDYFVYDGGYTFKFEEGVIRMAEISKEEDSYVIDHATEYFKLI